MSVSALALGLGAVSAAAYDPGYSGDYEIYYELLDQYGQKIGYDVTWCDGTREIYVEPGNNMYNQGPPFEGRCYNPKPLPF